MPAVDIDLVDIEDPRNLTQNSGSCSLYTICSKYGVNVVRIDAVLVNEAVDIAAGEGPKARNIGAVGRELERSSVSTLSDYRKEDVLDRWTPRSCPPYS